MPIFVNVSGVWKAVASVYVNVAGVWKAAPAVFTNVAGTWKRTHEAEFDVNLDTYSLYASCNDGSFCNATTDPVTATPAGGTGPFTYSWEFVSGDPTVTPQSPNSATTVFLGGSVTPSTALATYHCVVTDAFDVVGTSGEITVQLEFNT